MQHGPAVRRRKLGAELRALRTGAGLTSGEAARLVGWHQSKVSRIETGASGVKPADVRLLLDVYEVQDSQLRELLLVLAGSDEGGGRHHWWHAYRGVLPPTYRDFISLESQATAMRTLEISVVPGLLQTPEYARAVTRAAVGGLDGETDERLDALVEVRLARQLRRLVEAARLPQVRLQVLPFAAGAHIGITGPFVIFSFSRTSDLDVVVLDHLTSSLYLERKEDLRAYTEAFNTLKIHALSPEDSLDYIAGIGDGA